MTEKEPRYTVTVYTAAPGTPLEKSGGTSMAGHMYYAISDGTRTESFGFAPKEHGSSSGPGKVYDTDVADYKDPYYARTMEITKEQYEKLQEFGRDPAKQGFDMEYKGLTNSCVDFTWGGLNHAGLHQRRLFGTIEDKSFEGDLKPLNNIDNIKTIQAPFPDSDLNAERKNPMPGRNWKQWLISDADPSMNGQDMALRSVPAVRDPLHVQAESAVMRMEASQGRAYDGDSARLAASAACLGKQCKFDAIDHVVLGGNPTASGRGEHMFVVQGDLHDAAHQRAQMKTQDALAAPVEQSESRLQAMRQAEQLQLAHAPPAQELAMSPQHRM